jgi:hypothetical protein
MCVRKKSRSVGCVKSVKPAKVLALSAELSCEDSRKIILNGQRCQPPDSRTIERSCPHGTPSEKGQVRYRVLLKNRTSRSAKYIITRKFSLRAGNRVGEQGERT